MKPAPQQGSPAAVAGTYHKSEGVTRMLGYVSPSSHHKSSAHKEKQKTKKIGCNHNIHMTGRSL